MAENQDKKRRIVEELAQTRSQITGHGAILRHQLDFQARVSSSFRRHSGIWMTIAAFFGWIISRLPSRKRTVYLDSTKHSNPPI